MDLFGHEDPEEYIVRRRQEMERPAGFATHEALKEAITSCSRCPLRREGGLGPVLSTGPADAPLMIVGEGPGGVEDDYGGPLIGPSGQLLDKALASVGITRDHVYVTNIVKCRPRGNRTPTMDEGHFCGSIWLLQEIALARPAVIIGLGKVALRFASASAISCRASASFWATKPASSAPAVTGSISMASPSCRPSIPLTFSARAAAHWSMRNGRSTTTSKPPRNAPPPSVLTGYGKATPRQTFWTSLPQSARNGTPSGDFLPDPL